jgi:hypothetical protein
MIVFERLTSNDSTRRISYETYTRLIHAIKPDITPNIIDAYWKSLNIPNNENGLGIKYGNYRNEILFFCFT